MALIYADRVKETTATTGTGSFTLGGAQPGFISFASGITVGNTCYYACISADQLQWEVGLGTLTNASTLTRDTVLASTNAGARVVFGSGVKQIFNDYPAYAINNLSTGSLLFDSNTYVSTTFLTDGSTPQGQAFFSIAGNVTSTFPNGTVVTFANNVSAARYTVTGAVFQSTVTNVTITPALATAIPGNTLIYRYTGSRTSFNELVPGTNLSGSVTSNILTLNAATPPLQNFSYREDVIYRCKDNNNNAFNGFVTGDTATANLTFATPITANSGVSNVVLTFSSAIPASFTDGASILIFENTGLFNVTVANLDINGAIYEFDGEVNAIAGTTIPAATYGVTVARAAPTQSVEGLLGNVQFISSDGTVAITTDVANNAINLRSTVQGGGASGVQGTNEGDFIKSNILQFVDPQGDQGLAQIGTGSGVSTNSAVIDPGVGTDGWRFNGGQTRTLIQNVVAQLGAQRQRFRLTFSGTWNVQTWGAYPGVGSYQQYILRHPVFARNNSDWENDLDNMFPGFRPDPAVPGPAWQFLLPVTPVSYTPNRTDASGIRWSPNNGYVPTQGQSVPLVTYLNAAGIACVNVPINTSVTYTGNQTVTVPLKFTGSNRYVGSEFYVDTGGTGNSIPIRLSEGIAAGISLDQDLWPNADDRRLILWTLGQPSATSQTNAILEVWLEPNRWSADSSISWPNGFAYTNATQAAARYNFTWTSEDPVGISYSAIDYQMWNQNEDSPLSPLAGAAWNNRITVNLGSSTGGSGVTSVTSALNGLTFTNPMSVPQLTVQNAATPTTQFLRGDGTWQVPPTSGGTLLYADFLASARYNNTLTPTAATANFTVPSATNVPGTVHYYVRYTSAGASTPLYRFVPTTDSALTSLSYESFWSTFSGGVLSGLLIQKGQV